MGKPQIPKKVLDGISAVRDSGLTNMLDYRVVGNLCARMGFKVAQDWIEKNRGLYADLIFNGPDAFEVTE